MERAKFAVPFDVKFAPESTDGTIAGYGSVFGNKDLYDDVIVRGAFAKSIERAEKTNNYPAMLMQHGGFGMGADDLTPVGIWTRLEEDSKGLKVEGKLALDTQRGREAYSLLKMQPRPAINGLSIGYVATRWTMGSAKDGPKRTIEEIDLWEVSLVTFPANLKARISDVKSIRTKREFENFLRDAGFSRDAAKLITLRGFHEATDARDVPDVSFDELAQLLKGNIATLNTIKR